MGENTRFMFGRKVIYSDVAEVNASNVLDVLLKAETDHSKNRSEIDYLYKYYRGNQPIINRIKTIRPEINNKIVVNHANEIVSFKTGYLCGEPIQYVNRSSDETITDKINLLNEFMFSEDKSSQDEELVEWDMICGTAYRMVLPDSDAGAEPDEAPFEIYTLDPRDTFIVYSSDYKHQPLMGVSYWKDTNGMTHYNVYTDKLYFKIVNGQIVESMPHAYGMIPIFEYPANNARLGSFEIVLPLLDAINKIESNRLDGVEQTIQAFLKFINCEIDREQFEELKDLGAIKVKSIDGQNADVDVVKTELNQDQTQTLKKDIYDTVIVICGMPNRNGGSSTSDTGAAVIMRDGWSDAEARAKDSEHMFKRAEKKMLRLVLKICRDLSDIDLKLSDIDLKFTRRNYEAIQSKSQVLISMLQQDKIHPRLAFESSGLFIDPEAAYTMSMDYYEQEKLTAKSIPNPDEKKDDSIE
ncbi:MAG: phage portal protein [Firmicutes bacterium]|nr:phage portal protein [Bacillota bacterium]